MEMPPESVMVIHGGGTYGYKEATKKRWSDNYKKLPEHIRRRLVLENCERQFSVQDCLDISKMCGVPVVLDTHHFDCYNKIYDWDSGATRVLHLSIRDLGTLSPSFMYQSKERGKLDIIVISSRRF